MTEEEYNTVNFIDGIYRPPHHPGSIAQNATLGVKFSNDIYVTSDIAKEWGINETNAEWVPDHPLGPCWRIKR